MLLLMYFLWQPDKHLLQKFEKSGDSLVGNIAKDVKVLWLAYWVPY
jgi:hypothetical protein